jgi:hypothetical protein
MPKKQLEMSFAVIFGYKDQWWALYEAAVRYVHIIVVNECHARSITKVDFDNSNVFKKEMKLRIIMSALGFILRFTIACSK